MPRPKRASKKDGPSAAKAIPFPASVLWTSRYEYRHGRPLAKHSHSYSQIIFIADGRGQFHTREASHAAGRLDALLALPGEVHGFSADRGQRVLTLEVKFRAHENLLRPLSALPRVFPGDSGMHELLATLRREAEGKGEFQRARCDLLLCQFLLRRLQLTRSPGEEPPPRPALPAAGGSAAERAIHFVEKHFRRPFRLGEVAAACGHSYRHLSRQFQKQFGQSLGNWVRERRMRAAREILRTENLTCEQVALQCGFESAAHFNRVFKSASGLSPAAWRRREREGIRKDLILERGFVNHPGRRR